MAIVATVVLVERAWRSKLNVTASLGQLPAVRELGFGAVTMSAPYVEALAELLELWNAPGGNTAIRFIEVPLARGARGLKPEHPAMTREWAQRSSARRALTIVDLEKLESAGLVKIEWRHGQHGRIAEMAFTAAGTQYVERNRSIAQPGETAAGTSAEEPGELEVLQAIVDLERALPARGLVMTQDLYERLGRPPGDRATDRVLIGLLDRECFAEVHEIDQSPAPLMFRLGPNGFEELARLKRGQPVTPPEPRPADERVESAVDPRCVAVMHGRDEQARRAVFGFLRSLGLDPQEWEDLVAATGDVAPYNGQVVEAAFRTARVVVIVLTPDDVGYLHPDLSGPSELPSDREPTGQPRLNVVLEAGMALQSHPTRTIFVEIGHIRPISDLAGRNTVRLTGDAQALLKFKTRLETAGCAVKATGQDWLETEPFEKLAALRRRAPAGPIEAGQPGDGELSTFEIEVQAAADEGNVELTRAQLRAVAAFVTERSDAYTQFDLAQALPAPRPSTAATFRLLQRMNMKGLIEGTGHTNHGLGTYGQQLVDESADAAGGR